jgi:hypothetical protein
MIVKKCIHPKKANQIIYNFLNNAIVSPCEYLVKSINTKEVNYFAFGDIDDDQAIIFVPNWKKANYKKDLGGKCFRADFISRCPIAQGFSDVTLSLLHEVGHTMTKALVPPMKDEIDRYNEAVEKTDDMKEVNKLYFALTDERMATDWAIEWLQNSDNRKMAKEFENEFFKNFTSAL